MCLTASVRLIERTQTLKAGPSSISRIKGVKIMEEYTMESVVRGYHVYKVDSTKTCCRTSAISISSSNFVTSIIARTDVPVMYGY